MNKLFITLLSCFLLLINTSTYSQTKDSATIFLIGDVRSHEPGKGITQNVLDDMLTRANIFMDSLLICKLPEQRYSKHFILAGTHSFGAQPSGKKRNKHNKGIQLEIKAGETYYLQVYGKDNDMYLVSITKDFAKKVAGSLKPAAKCE